MTGNIGGISSYQQTNQIYKNNQKSTVQKNSATASTESKTSTDVKVSEWKPVSAGSSLIPTSKTGYGTIIGDVELSDKAKDYYNKLKSKFSNMEFIAVSSDMKSQVAANASAYGNANKQVVLIDTEKLEMMANDESFRKKYEGIIAMSQTKLAEAKNSLASSGANIKNFGMSVDSNGNTSFFATVEKANNEQTKALEKRQAAKKAAKIKEQKAADKKAREDRIKKRQEAKKADEKAREEKTDETSDDVENKTIPRRQEYVDFKADSLDELLSQVSKYAFDNSERGMLAEAANGIGQNIDFRG